MENKKTINEINNFFFIGVAGSGMSALAQYLVGIGKTVSGSDRYFADGVYNETKEKLEAEGIKCYPQNGIGINAEVEIIIVITPIIKSIKDNINN